jgi:FKBP-type peptidyl-prolyl cis-trans isomerase FkpA
MGRTWAFPLFLAIVLAGCGEDTVADPQDLDYADALEIDIESMTRTNTGLYYQDVTVGTGAQAAAGDSVFVLYSGWLPNGTLFDTTDDNGVPISFTLGAGRVIDGWDEGLAGMRVGGVRKLVIPPSLGYGAQANPPIPANAVLVFRVELVDVQ